MVVHGNAYTPVFNLPFSVWCPLKGHLYLQKTAVFSCKFSKYMRYFTAHQVLKG